MSTGPFDSLNTSTATGDSPDAVNQNLERIATRLRVKRSELFFASQVHGARALVVERDSDVDAVLRQEADAVVSTDPVVACAVRVADCAPVLIADSRTGAVAAVHSGWRGTVQKIVPTVVELMVRNGSQVEDLIAAVGPHLESCCFEVGQDVADRIAACSSAPYDSVVLMQPGEGARPHADLRVVLEHQLRDVGVPSSQISHVRGCTYCRSDLFFSYRRDGVRSGRLLAAIRPSER